MEFPTQLRAQRERLSLSQEDIAQRVYVSRQTISNWETGKTYPDIQSLLLLSNLFDVSVDELLKGDVASMEDRIKKDSRTITHLSWAMLGCLIAMLATVGVAIVIRDIGPETSYGMSAGSLVAFIVAGILFLCAFAAAVIIEVLKRQNNIVTFKEIAAFEKGIPVDEAMDKDAFSRRHPVISTICKVFFGAVFALAALVIFEVIAKSLRDLIFGALS